LAGALAAQGRRQSAAALTELTVAARDVEEARYGQ
jgi:hypothetical protein